jgi:hypothetical protein
MDAEQLTELVARVHARLVAGPEGVRPERMWALGLYRSVVLVLFLLRQNPVQQVAAELFGVSQATVSRRWTVLLPVVAEVLRQEVPDPVEVSRGRVVLVDGTLVTTWDWRGPGTSLWSGKHRDTGVNVQVAATLAGDLLAVAGPVPGSWHDVKAWNASSFPTVFAECEQLGDLGYMGTGMVTGRRKPPRQPRPAGDKILNQSISKRRSAVERAIAHLKDWKILATRYRGPLHRLSAVINAVTALTFYKNAPAGT